MPNPSAWPARFVAALSPRVCTVALLLLAVLPYVPAVQGGFVFDDQVAITRNQAVTSDLSLINILDSGFWGGKEENNSGSYRPLTVLTFAIEYRLGGGSPLIFHVSNILLHAACVLVVFGVIRRRWSTPLAAGVAGLFAVFAVHTENVAGLVARADILAVILGMLAWHLYAHPRARVAAASGVLFLLSLMAKEIGVAFLGVIIAEEILGLSPGRDRPLRLRLLLILSMIAAVALYLALRMAAIDRFASHVVPQSNPLLLATHLSHRVWTASALLAQTTELMLFPAVLSADYSYAQILPITSPWAGPVLTGLGLWLLLPVAALLFRKRAPMVSVGLLLFLAAYTPISNLLLLVPTIFAERLLYLPSLGFLMAVVAAAAIGWRRVPRWRGAIVILFLGVIAGHATRSFVRSRDWQSPRSIFEAATVSTPLSARNWFNLGVAALDEDEPEEAIRHFQKSLAIAPNQPLAHSFIGVALEKLDRPKEAHEAMYRSVRMEPWCKMCTINLVDMYVKYAFFDDARITVQRYLRVTGDSAEANRLSAMIDEVEAAARDRGIEPKPAHDG